MMQNTAADMSDTLDTLGTALSYRHQRPKNTGKNKEKLPEKERGKAGEQA